MGILTIHYKLSAIFMTLNSNTNEHTNKCLQSWTADITNWLHTHDVILPFRPIAVSWQAICHVSADRLSPGPMFSQSVFMYGLSPWLVFKLAEKKTGSNLKTSRVGFINISPTYTPYFYSENWLMTKSATLLRRQILSGETAKPNGERTLRSPCPRR